MTTNIRISKRTLDALATRDRPYIAFDDTVKGFGVRTAPSGAKTFVLEYRPGGGGRGVYVKRLTLGRFGAMTAEQARAAALDALAHIRLGDDPQLEKSRQRASLTVAGLTRAFAEGHIAKLKPKSRESYEGVLAKIRAAYGLLKAEALTRAQVAALHSAMSDTPYAANRMLAVGSKMFSWGETVGHLPECHPNPFRRIGRHREQARQRYLTGDELARLGDALREGETIGLPYAVDETKPNSKHAPKIESRLAKIDPYAAGAIRLLCLTGARLREILHAKWDEVDLGRGALFLADSKTGRKLIYLGAAAQAVLASIPRLEGNPYIIPGAKDGAPRSDLKGPWAAVTRAAGLDRLRVHDLRHSFGSIAAGASLGLPVIGRLLGHATPATTARYSHLGDDPLRRAVETIGSTIDGAMNRKAGTSVVRLK